jgi:GNAT superfamily N-acetyltransferase/AraC-like DNA-binding protein
MAGDVTVGRARRPLLRAWRPDVPGVAEVFHAYFPDHAYPMHTHDTWALLIVDTGMVRYDLDRHEHGALRDLVTLLPPHVPHDGRSVTETGFRKRVLYLDEDALEATRIGSAVDHPGWSDPVLRSQVHHLHRALGHPGDAFEAESRLALVRERLSAHLAATEPPGVRRDRTLAHRMRAMIDDRTVPGLTLAEAATDLGASETHLVRAFTREHGIAPHSTSPAVGSTTPGACSCPAAPPPRPRSRSASTTRHTSPGTSPGCSVPRPVRSRLRRRVGDPYPRSMTEVELREVTPEVLDELRAHVVLPPEQVRYVGTVDGALDEAAQVPEAHPWFRGVYADGRPVGFVMLGWDVEPVDGLIGPWFLWKLMVSPAVQGQGVGRAIVDRVVEIVREHDGTELFTSYTEGPGDPSGFYAALGFEPTGRRHGDEMLVARPV